MYIEDAVLTIRRWCGGLVVVALVATGALGGCAAVKPEVREVVHVREVTVPMSVPVVGPLDAAGRQLLAWSDELRAMPAEGLAQEAARLGDGKASASASMRLALLLGQARNPGDLARALTLLEGVLRDGAGLADAEPTLDWQPWARWLLSRYQAERRLEDQLERQTTQLRESLRRQEQLKEKLEALKAIERQLAPRRAPEGAGR